MKHYRQKSVGVFKSVAIWLVLSLGFVASSFAGDYGSSGQPYFSLSALVVSPDASEVTNAGGVPGAGVLNLNNSSLDNEVGWGINGAFGWLYDSNWHYEVELGHKAFDLGDAFVPGAPQPVVGEWNVETFFLNGGYDFRGDSFITPYVGAGIGVALHELTIETINSIPIALKEQFQVTPAFQAMVGVNLEIAEDVDVSVGYRFLTAVNPDFSAISFERVDIHNFEMGLKFYIEDWIN